MNYNIFDLRLAINHICVFAKKASKYIHYIVCWLTFLHYFLIKVVRLRINKLFCPLLINLNYAQLATGGYGFGLTTIIYELVVDINLNGT